MEEETEKSQSIPQLFNGKCVLVTGATGFLGKVLIEKLLRSCPDIKELFILLRTSDKGDAPKRLKVLLEHHIFDRLRIEQSGALQKIRAFSGDIVLDNLGLSDWQLQKVTKEVSFIFHCAANVRFDDEPRNTLTTNLLAVRNVLDVCKSCKQLEAIVHVSTSFSFCNQPEVSEELYPEVVAPHHIIEALGWMSNEECRLICNHYAQDRPSVYHYSKALAESLVAESDSLPAIIVRPAIVTASFREPFPGWIDNHNGPSGFIAVCGKGIVKTLLVKPNINADWVPVDIVANTLIVAAHYIAIKSKLQNPALTITSPAKVPIINCTCPETNMITWKKITQICVPFLVDYPSEEIYGKPGGTVTSCIFLYLMRRYVSHYIPALFIDGTSCLMFKRPRLFCIYRRIHRVMSHLEHYTTHSFVFRSPNMRRLIDQMDSADRKLFPIDQNELDWTQYMENYVLGVRRYYLREKDETLPKARIKMMRFHYFWLAMRLTSVFGIYLMIRRTWKLHALKNLESRLSCALFSTISFLRCQIEFLTK